MKKCVTFLGYYLCALVVFSQTTETVADGNWNSDENWSNESPADDDEATVNHSMTLNTHLNINDGKYVITDDGELNDPTGGTDYNIDVRGTGYFEVSGNVKIGGDFEVRNSSTFILRSCDTMVVQGDADFSGGSSLLIEECAVLLVSGNLDLSNDNLTTVNGNVVVGGDVITRNFSSITGAGFLQTAGEIDIRNSSSVFGSSVDCSPGPCEYGTGGGLPIELLTFSAKKISNKEIELEWTTISEINNDYFTLEYTLDGKTFTVIDTFNGAGNSQTIKAYKTVFHHNTRETIYFKLTQTDYNGDFESFDLITTSSLDIKKNVDVINSAKIFPNPGYGQFISVKLGKQLSQKVEVRVYSSEGLFIYDKIVLLDENQTEFKIDNLNFIKSGIYIFKIRNGNNTTILKYFNL